MIHDWRTQRRWYATYAYAGCLTVFANVAAVLIAPTKAWLTIAAGLESLGG
jgi:hypothetical protein